MANHNGDDNFWDDDDDDAFLDQVSQFVESKLAPSKSSNFLNEDEFEAFAKCFSQDDEESKMMMDLEPKNERFLQNQTIFQTDRASSSKAPDHTNTEKSNSNFKFRKPSEPSKAGPSSLNEKNEAIIDKTSMDKEIKELKTELQKLMAEKQQIQYQQKGELLHLRSELAKKDELLQKAKSEKQREIELKNEEMRQYEAKIKAEEKNKRDEADFLQQEIRNLQEQLRRKSSNISSQVPQKRAVETPSHQPPSKRKAGGEHFPKGMNSSFLEIPETKREKPSAKLKQKDSGIQAVISKKRKNPLTLRHSQDTMSHLSNILMTNSPTVSSVLLSTSEQNEEISSLGQLLALTKISKEAEDKAIRNVAQKLILRCVDQFKLVFAENGSCEQIDELVTALKVYSPSNFLLDKNVLESLVSLGINGCQIPSRFSPVIPSYLALMGTLLSEEIVTDKDSVQLIYKMLIRMLKTFKNYTVCLAVQAILEKTSCLAHCNEYLCGYSKESCCVFAFCQTVNYLSDQYRKDPSELRADEITELAKHFLHWMCSAMIFQIENGCPTSWLGKQTSQVASCQKCRMSALLALTTLVATTLTVSYRFPEKKSSSLPVVKSGLICLHQILSLDSTNFSALLASNASVKTDFVWLTKQLEEIKVSLKLSSIEATLIAHLKVDYEEGGKAETK